MSLTPKNWQTFQHYKDRAPVWIKLHRALLDDADFQCLPVASKALAPMLWLVASEYEGGCITVPAQKIAWRLRMSLDDFTDALRPLIDGGFFDASEPLAQRTQEAMPEKRREETETETETEEETDSRSVKDRPARKRSDEEHPRFAEFWQQCPRRDGANPRKPACSRFSSLVKTGADPQMLIDEAVKWRSAEEGRGKIGTPYVARVITWLNENRWSDHAAVAALREIGGEKPAGLSLEGAVELYARAGIWSRHSPVSDVSQAPPELLAKYGLLPDGRKMPPREAA